MRDSAGVHVLTPQPLAPLLCPGARLRSAATAAANDALVTCRQQHGHHGSDKSGTCAIIIVSWQSYKDAMRAWYVAKWSRKEHIGACLRCIKAAEVKIAAWS